MSCRHNARMRYGSGFLCEDCMTFFDRDSPTYRSDELLSTLWCVLNNIFEPDARAMRDKIGIGIVHEDYEALIAEAEVVMARYGKNDRSADMPLGPPHPDDKERMKLYEDRKP